MQVYFCAQKPSKRSVCIGEDMENAEIVFRGT